MGDTAGDRREELAAETAGPVEEAGRNEYLRIMATVILGIVVKGLDLERADLVGLGYGEKSVYRAFRSLRKAKVLKKVTKKNYALRTGMVAAVRKLAEEDIGRPVGWPNIHNFLFVAYGMFDWDERRMDTFLSFLKEDWLHRMRASGRLERSAAVKGAKGREEVERTYSLREAAAMLGVTVRTIQRWGGQGKIRCVSPSAGARRRVPETEIRRVLGVKGSA